MRKLNVLLILCFALLFASIAQGQSNNAALSGNYAFNFTGVSGNGATSSLFWAVGRFTAPKTDEQSPLPLTPGKVNITTAPAGTPTPPRTRMPTPQLQQNCHQNSSQPITHA